MEINKVWCMPNSRTFEMKPTQALLRKHIGDGLWIDPFANNKKYAQITNDLNEKYDTNYHLDALDFLQLFESESVDGVIYDPPYSPRQIKEEYESVGLTTKGGELTKSNFWSKHKNEIARIVKPNGKVLCFGWNSMGIGKKRGFEMEEILLIAHGGNHNDTICTVEHKINGGRKC